MDTFKQLIKEALTPDFLKESVNINVHPDCTFV